MSFPDVLGYLLGAGAIFGAVNVVIRRDAVIAAMNLVLVFFCLSGVYLLLGFPFLATIQVLVYAGAIMVLFLFVIMLLGVSRLESTRIGSRTGLAAAIALAIVVEGSVIGVQLAAAHEARPDPAPVAETVAGVAKLLFDGPMVLPFEIAGVVLLAAMIGVVVLGRRDFSRKSIAEMSRERAFDPRPLIGRYPDAVAPDYFAHEEAILGAPASPSDAATSKNAAPQENAVPLEKETVA